MTFPFYIRVREVLPFDYEGIHYLDRETFVSPISKEWFLDRIRHSNPYFFVSVNVITGRIVGFITGYESPSSVILAQKPGHYKYGFISRVAVDPAYRKMGIGDALLRSVENRFYWEHRKGILVSTRLNNTGAMRFYRNHNYTKMETFDGTEVYQFGRDMAERTMVVMYKKLIY